MKVYTVLFGWDYYFAKIEKAFLNKEKAEKFIKETKLDPEYCHIEVIEVIE